MLKGATMSLPISMSSTKNWTRVTPTLSDAAASIVTIPDTVLSAAGAEMLTEGLTMSGVTPTFTIPTAVCPSVSRISYVKTSLVAAVAGGGGGGGGVYVYGSEPVIVPPAELVVATRAMLRFVPLSLARRKAPAKVVGPATFSSESGPACGHVSFACGVGGTAHTGTRNVCVCACIGITIVSTPSRSDAASFTIPRAEGSIGRRLRDILRSSI